VTVKDRAICQFLDGHLRCFELKTGKVLWEKDLAAEFGMTQKGAEPMFQACSSPLLAGDQVIVMVCTDTIGLLSLNVADGKEVWRTPSFGNYGSSLGFMKMGETNVAIAVPSYVDRKQFKDGDVLGYNALNGELVWNGNAGKSYYNTPPPIANDGLLAVEGGGGDGPTLLFSVPSGGGAKAEVLWKDENHLARWSNYLIYHGAVFGQGFHAHGPKKDIGIRLFCNDAKAGTNFWHTEAKERHHSMIGSDNKIIQLHENGELSMFDATVRDGYKELARARVVAQKGGVWSFPALAQGRLYVRTDSELVCLDLTEKQ
jgi:outer membrane protein assembly factor BamB